MLRTPFTILVICLCAGLAGCVPPPVGVPRNASVAYNWKGSGWTWSWVRTLESGCIEWTATESYAGAYVSIDSGECAAPDHNGARILLGRGLNYYSFHDHITFLNYWPAPEMSGGRICPEALSAEQIAELRAVMREATAPDITDGETRVLNRIDQLLAATDAAALTTDASGWCNDLKPEHYRAGGSRPQVDPWLSR